jgi:hypothetical protein
VVRVTTAVFWVVAPCRLVIALIMEAVQTSETLVHSYKSTRRYNPEDSRLQCYLIGLQSIIQNVLVALTFPVRFV